MDAHKERKRSTKHTCTDSSETRVIENDRDDTYVDGVEAANTADEKEMTNRRSIIRHTVVETS